MPLLGNMLPLLNHKASYGPECGGIVGARLKNTLAGWDANFLVLDKLKVS